LSRCSLWRKRSLSGGLRGALLEGDCESGDRERQRSEAGSERPPGAYATRQARTGWRRCCPSSGASAWPNAGDARIRGRPTRSPARDARALRRRARRCRRGAAGLAAACSTTRRDRPALAGPLGREAGRLPRRAPVRRRPQARALRRADLRRAGAARGRPRGRGVRRRGLRRAAARRPIALEAGEPLEQPKQLDDCLPAVGGAAASAAVMRAVASGDEDGAPGDAVALGAGPRLAVPAWPATRSPGPRRRGRRSPTGGPPPRSTRSWANPPDRRGSRYGSDRRPRRDRWTCPRG